jgi:Family of unknown function (DUF6445)
MTVGDPGGVANVQSRRVLSVGHEAEPVMVVEDAVSDPWGLVACAAHDTQFEPARATKNFYPGLLAPAPLAYVSGLVRALDPMIRKTFGLTDVKPGRASCNFSIVTAEPKHLNLAQRLPHVDTVDPLQFAILHYLCGPQFRGTAFYRHRATGFETLTPERTASYKRTLDAELDLHPPQAGYIVGDTPLFAQTAQVGAAFNRVIVYRSRLLHSGQVDASAGLSPDPEQGRLTANIFLNYQSLS